MKLTKIIITALAILLMTSCGGDDDKDTKKETERFELMTVDMQVINKDTKTKLQWVNGKTDTAPASLSSGCHPMAPGKTSEEVLAEAKSHCSDLVFAGKDDWRVPTSMESKVYLEAMKADGKTPFYQNVKCPRVVGLDSGVIKNINTHNTNPIGKITDWAEANAGVRCVRNEL